MQSPLAAHTAVALPEFASQVPVTAGQFWAVQAAPEMLQVPVPVAGQLALDMQEAPETLHVPASVGQFALLVHDVPVWTLHLPPLIGHWELFVHDAPAAVPPQRLTGEQVPEGHEAPLRSQVRPVFGQAVVEQSALVPLHRFSVGHCAFAVQDVPSPLQVPAIVGQSVAALAAVHGALLTLHLPTSVQTEALLVQSSPPMLHFLLHCWTSWQFPSGFGTRLQPAGCQVLTQLAASVTQLLTWTLQVCDLTLLQVWFLVLQVCGLPALQVCATGLHAVGVPLQVCVCTPLQV